MPGKFFFSFPCLTLHPYLCGLKKEVGILVAGDSNPLPAEPIPATGIILHIQIIIWQTLAK